MPGIVSVKTRTDTAKNNSAQHGAVVLYARPGCHLCEEVEGWLLEAGIEWRSLDIAADPGLYERYKHRIPVIDVGGREVLSAPISRAELRRVLLGD
jgi:glutaredoxin